MDVLDELLTRDRLNTLERPSETSCYRMAGERGRSYSYEKFFTNAWKAGNLLCQYGVRDGMTIGVVDAPKHPDVTVSEWEHDPARTPIPETLLSFFGATLLGATVRFDPPTESKQRDSFDRRAIVGPSAWADDYQCQPGCTYLGYGDPPEDPTVVHFETELWSENPIAPPNTVESDSVALRTDTRAYTHRNLLDAARSLVEEFGITSGNSVAIRASLVHPGTVVGGVIAPLLAGAEILVGRSQAANLVVTEAHADREKRLSPDEIFDPS